MTHYCSVAVRGRWDTWQVEQVAIHNFYVVLQSHWRPWRVKAFCAAEIISYLAEAARHAIKPRSDLDVPGDLYQDRLRKRLALTTNFLLGREEPIRRFQPEGRSERAA